MQGNHIISRVLASHLAALLDKGSDNLVKRPDTSPLVSQLGIDAQSGTHILDEDRLPRRDDGANIPTVHLRKVK
jgi:hypothetical protein